MIEVAETIPDKQLKAMAEGDGDNHAGHDHKHGDHDPHVWLGPPQAKVMVVTIAAKLSEIDTPDEGPFSERFVFPDGVPLPLSRIALAMERTGFVIESCERTSGIRAVGPPKSYVLGSARHIDEPTVQRARP